LIGVAYLSYSATGTDLLPPMDEGGFIVDYIMPAGSSLAETNRVITHVENILRATPEVENTSRRTGLQLGLAQVTEANTGDISVKLKSDRHRNSEEVIAEVRDKIKKAEPVLDVEIVQLLQDMIGDLTSAPEPVVIKLFAQDPALLHQWGPAVGDAIKKIPGVVDVLNGVENTISGPARVFTVDPVATARAGFTPQEVEVDTSAILQGEPATTPVVVNDRSYTIRVRFPREENQTIEAIQNTLLVSGTGKTATLGTLTKMVEIPGQNEIRRENLQRNIQVTARFEGMSLGAGMPKVQQAIADLHLPPAIRVQYGGLFEEQQKSFRDFAFVLVLAIILVFIVLLFEFGDFSAPIAVLCSALLSTCGVFLALVVTGMTFNLSSFMGLIMVIGIVAKNGILLLDADQRFRSEGIPAEQSMIQAGERRLRPIMMTALATMAGMLPLAFGIGAGSQMLQPLAIAVIGGVLASMVLSLIVTPAVRYYIGGRNGETERV
jgi:multidrug efflux pump subunit AcrB